MDNGDTPHLPQEHQAYIKMSDNKPLCKYCQDSEDLSELITPCACKGSVGFVHRRCLDQWREKNAQAYHRCDICKTAYQFEQVSNTRGLMLARVLISLESFSAFCAWQATVCLVGVMYRITDPGVWQAYCPSLEQAVCYYLYGALYFYAVVGVCALLIGLFAFVRGDATMFQCNVPSLAAGKGAVVAVFFFALFGVGVALVAFIALVQYIIETNLSALGRRSHNTLTRVRGRSSA